MIGRVNRSDHGHGCDKVFQVQGKGPAGERYWGYWAKRKRKEKSGKSPHDPKVTVKHENTGQTVPSSKAQVPSNGSTAHSNEPGLSLLTAGPCSAGDC